MLERERERERETEVLGQTTQRNDTKYVNSHVIPPHMVIIKKPDNQRRHAHLV